MKRILFYINLIIISLVTCYGVQAQSIDSSHEHVSAVVVDEFGEPIENAIIRSSVKGAGCVTNAQGKFSIACNYNDFITVNKQSVASVVVRVTAGELASETIVLESSTATPKDKNITVAKGNLPFDRITGSVERVTGEDLADFPSFYSMEALSGRMSGLQVGFGSTTIGSETFNVTSRGESITTFVDGLPTTNITSTVEEIEDIIIAKDFGSSSLLGTGSSTGAMMINSKRGEAGEFLVKLSANTGLRMPTYLPDMMDSYQYAQTINQARLNDGDSEVYSQEALDAYKSGSNQLLYPTHDYYDELVSNAATYTNVNADISGGNDVVQYYSSLGYYGTTGMESVGYGRESTNIRFNNNVLIHLGTSATVDLGISGGYYRSTEPGLTSDNLFAYMYKYAPNAMPWMMNDSVYVKTPQYSTNMLAELSASTKLQNEQRNSAARLGFNYDLGAVTSGLTFNALVGITVDNTISQALQPSYNYATPVLMTSILGEEYLEMTRYSTGVTDQSWARYGTDIVERGQYVNASLNYDNSFDNGKHQVNAVLNYTMDQSEVNSTIQYLKDRSTGLRVNYMLNNKYVLEGNAVIGNSRTLDVSTRTELFYTGGAAWLLHKEDFLSGASWLDYLKLRVNGGVMGTSFFAVDDNTTSYYLYESLYELGGASGSFGTSSGTSTTTGRMRVSTAAAEGSIDWPKRINLNVGFDYILLGGKIQGQANYFNNRYTGQLAIPTSQYAILGYNSANLAYENYVETTKKGFDARVAYKGNSGDFKYMVDANAMYLLPYNNVTNSDDYEYSYRNTSGAYSDIIYGLDADGLFQSAEEAASSTHQSFGTVTEGDIKYLNYNGDDVIDENDYHEIGHANRFTFGLNLAFKYKNFGLTINTDGALGGQRISSVMWSTGTNNYLTAAEDSYPVSNTYPRLTITEGSNNYRNSSFWLVSASYFNLRAVTFSYNLPAEWMTKMAIKDAKVYVSGKNLATISADNLTYPLLTSSGYSVSPVLNAFELGVNVSF